MSICIKRMLLQIAKYRSLYILMNNMSQVCVKPCLDVLGVLLSTDGDPALDHHQAEVPGGPAGQGRGQAEVGGLEKTIIRSSVPV